MLGEVGLRAGRALPLEAQPRPGGAPPGRPDDGVRRRDDLRGGAVVAHEAHDRRLGEDAREVEQVGRAGAGERVDRLVGVADHGEVVAPAEPGPQQAVLGRGDVLELVDHEAAVALVELVGHLRVLLERRGRVEQQVVEVELLGAVLERLVGLVDLRDLLDRARDVAGGPAGRLRVVVRGHERGLGPLDLAGEVAQRLAGGRRPGALGGLPDERAACPRAPPTAPRRPRAARSSAAGAGPRRGRCAPGPVGGPARRRPARAAACASRRPRGP